MKRPEDELTMWSRVRKSDYLLIFGHSFPILDISMLWVAVNNSRFEICRLLLVTYGANVNFGAETDATPLLLAAWKSSLPIGGSSR